jgi:hypothetical protein
MYIVAVAELQPNTWAGQIEKEKKNHVLPSVLLLFQSNAELKGIFSNQPISS